MEKANLTKLTVGYGMAKGDDSFATGVEAARQATADINECPPLSAVLVFASVHYDLEELLRGIHSVVGETLLLGTTTAGEICDGPQQESVVVVALASPYLKLRVGVGEGVSQDWRGALSQALSAPGIRPFFSGGEDAIWPELARHGKSAFALLFSPGNTRHADSRSYEILEELKRLSGGQLPIFGGSSADDWRMEANYVLWGEHANPDSLLVAVFETQLCFGTALAHGFRPGPRQATVTRARGHEVLELDSQPAAEVYARMLGMPQEELEGKHLTLTTGQPAGSPDPYGQHSINVASYFTPQGGVRFSQPALEGTTLTIMEVDEGSLIAAGQEALRKALLRGQVGDPALVLVFSCALRTRILGERMGEEITGMRDMVPGVPLVGFYSFGEQGLADDGVNRHNNEVITTLVLGRKLSYAAQVALENERLREDLWESKERYRTLVENINDVIYRVDIQGRVTYISSVMEQLTQYKVDEIVGQPFTRFVHPDDLPGLLARLERTLAGELESFEFRIFDKNDAVRHVRSSSRLLLEDDQPVGLTGVITDITARVQAEEALKETERRYRNLFEEAPVMYIVTRNREGAPIIADCNQTLLSTLGYSRAEVLERPLADFYTPESSHELLAGGGYLRAMAGNFLSEERQLLARDSRVIHTLLHAAPETDANDRRVGTRSIFIDITARKQAEEALVRAKEEWERTFDVMPDLVMILDDRHRIVRANKAMADRLGITPQKAVGLTCYECVHALESPPSFCPHAQLLTDGQEHVVEVHEGRLGGDFLVTASPLHDPEGRAVGSVHVARDITERVQDAEENRRRTAQLEALREVGLELTAQLDLATLLHSIATRAVELIGGSGGGVYLYRPDTDGLEWTMSIGSNMSPPGTALRRGEGLSGKVWESGQSLIVDDYRHWEGRAAVYDGYPFTAVVAVPIRWGQESLGVLNVTANPPHTFSPADAELLSLFATQAAIAIENARLYEQARQDAETKAALLREVNHRVKNNLTAIIGLLYAEQRRAGAREQPLYQIVMRELINRVQGLAAVHSLLSASEWAPLRLSELAMEIIQSALKTLPHGERASVDVSPSPVRVTPDQAHNLALVFNELATNTIKHALAGREGGCITVHISLDDDTVLCEFRDDGPGYPEGASEREGHNVGLDLIREIVRRSLRGDLSLRNDGGAVALIRFKAEVR
jgi:PAS domain S-box-containing protein